MTGTYDHETSRWGVGDFLVCGVGFFGLSIGLVALLGVTGSAEGGVLPRFWLPLILALPPAAELAYVAWAARSRGNGLAADFGFSFKRDDIVQGFRFFVMVMLGAGVVVAVWAAVFGDPPTAAAVEIAQAAEGGDGITIWLVFFAVLGATFIPVVEELVFRGLLWSALEKRGHSPNTVLLVTSAAFALFHLEPARTPVLFLIGLALGVARRQSGRIGASIVTHMLINGLGMVALLSEFAN